MPCVRTAVYMGWTHACSGATRIWDEGRRHTNAIVVIKRFWNLVMFPIQFAICIKHTCCMQDEYFDIKHNFFYYFD